MTTIMKSVLVFVVTAASVSAGEMVLVKDGKPSCAIVVGKKATEIETHAARELARYLFEMSGTGVRITSKTVDPGTNVIAIGRSHTNPLISDLITDGRIRLDSENPGHDGFILETLRYHDRNILVAGGSADRSALYAVYHLLEHYLDVGFYENGDQIPRRSDIRIPEIHYAHKPRFKLRINQQGCIWDYTYRYWDVEQFKTLVDWMVKKKYNAFWWNDPGRTAIIKRVFRKNGLDYDKMAGIYWKRMTPEWEEHELKLLGQVARYAVSRGLEVIGYCPVPELPEAFLGKYPEEKVLEVEWNAIAGEKRYYLNPQSPMFARIIRDGAEEFEKAIGGPVHWWSQAPYGEMLFTNVSESEIENIYVDYVDGMYRALSSRRPDFGWLMSGWGYLVDPYWNEERSSKFFNRTRELFGKDRYCVSDPEAYHQPIFRKFDGFYNNGWCVGIIHSYAGTTQLFGDLVNTKDHVLQCLNSPWGDNLYAYWVQPEIIGHNPFFYEAVADIGWDPYGFSLEKFTRRFVRNRYSGIGTDSLVKTWDLIIQAYYSQTTYLDQGIYLSPPALRDPSAYPPFFNRLPLAQQALDLFFQNGDRLGDNRFFQTDLIDLLLQFNAGLYNYHYCRMMEAFQNRDQPAFDAHARQLGNILDAQVKVLRTHPDKYVAREIRDAARRPQEHPDFPNEVAIRTRLTSLVPVDVTVNKINNTDDYARKDMYELVKDYYLPRAHLHIEALRKALAEGRPAPSRESLSRECYMLTKRFIETPSEVQPLSRPAPDLVKTAAEVFQSLRLNENRLKELSL